MKSRPLPPAPRPAAPSFSPSRRRFAVLGGGSLLALAGCGGGSDPEPPPAPPPVEPPPPSPTPAPPPPPGQPADTLPVITAQPQSVAQPPSNSVVLRVEATGPNLVYQWKHNGNAIAGATSTTLEVSNAAGAIERYSVTVSNGAGSVESAEAVVAAVVPFEKLSLLAGGLGGRGYLEGRGTEARLLEPEVTAVTPSGDVFFAMSLFVSGSAGFGGIIAKASPEGDVRFLGMFPHGGVPGLATDKQGTLYAVSGNAHVICKLVEGANPTWVVVAGVPQTSGFQDGTGAAARLGSPRSLVFDGTDQFYFLDIASRTVRRMGLDGTVVTVAGAPANKTRIDGQGAAAGFADMGGFVRMADGTFLVHEPDGLSPTFAWRRVTPGGAVTTLPVRSPQFWPLLGDGADAVLGIDGHSVVRVGLDGSFARIAGRRDEFGYRDGIGDEARFQSSPGLAWLPNGDLLVDDGHNYVLRRLELASRRVTPWAGLGPQRATANGQGAAARFDNVVGLALDPSGTLCVLEGNGTLRRVAADGTVTTVTSGFPADGRLAIDAAGNFYGARKSAIIKVTPAGQQSVFAGQEAVRGFADGAASEARFARPLGMVFDREGNLIVGDAPDESNRMLGESPWSLVYGQTIRKITPAGQVSTIAGVAGRVVSSNAQADPVTDFRDPSTLAVDAAGNIFVQGSSIRRLGAPGTPPTVLPTGVEGFIRSLAVTPGGAVYFGHTLANNPLPGLATVRRLSAGASERVAGVDTGNQLGVRPGPLPASLNYVDLMVAARDGSLFVLSENSILKIGPA